MKQIKLVEARSSKWQLLAVIFVLALAAALASSDAQIVSHELRRLAMSTNQFGIDALKALDKIEPAHKVIVFCPVCLSASLASIMMGSSKYQAVSSLRQALYVWSMRPQDINKGYKDLLEHIAMNQQQQQQQVVAKPNSIQPVSRSFKEFGEARRRPQSISVGPELRAEHRTARAASAIAQIDSNLSLIELMRAKEIIERLAGAKSSARVHRTNAEPATLSSKNESVSRFATDPNCDMSQMSALNLLYVQRGVVMNYNYNRLLRQYYKSTLHPIDFVRNTEETRQHINSLVAASTEGKIKDLIKRGLLDAPVRPKALIVNTFHFRGTLDIQVRAGGDEPANKTAQKSRTFIETVPTLLKYGKFASLGCSVIEIPFSNRLVSLVIVMPNDLNSTDLLLTKLSAQVLSDMINSLQVKKLSIAIPVIKFDRGPINVAGLLGELGLDQIFSGARTHMTTETGLNRWMRPTDIIHETSIDIGTVNPKFTQTEDRLKVGAHDDAYNVTKPNGSTKSARDSTDTSNIKLDSNFFYFVFDSINSLVLTMGRIRQ